jgi:hypothetical protein
MSQSNASDKDPNQTRPDFDPDDPVMGDILTARKDYKKVKIGGIIGVIIVAILILWFTKFDLVITSVYLIGVFFIYWIVLFFSYLKITRCEDQYRKKL